jgi:dipeptidyl aminopeptidase/acylaminoacyl peptidase
VKFFSYAARDGLSIPAYLTLPYGSSGRNLPLVVMPHGGPEARDGGDFDGWAQFLASRGYAVLQPQFRGSAGFGKAFRDAGRRKWGLEMQHDVTDGVKHLIATGVADASRVCIVGWSYGGYSTLAGLAFSPELYKCGVAGAAVSDLPEMLDWVTKRQGRDLREDDYWTLVIGHRMADHDRLVATSPARHASKIRVPVLLVHGRDDTTVPIAQSEIMANALKLANKPYEFVAIDGDDHYLSKSKTGIDFLGQLERFLGQHLR